ncbi:MAG TPA: 3-oxoacyl-ACP reductase family protein [Terriglobales bacterium]|nr:3-oxoacyl-ACP reductase family protein [Terriglobales bacterium]
MTLAGRRALVTGASRGIGRATALALAQAGAKVAVNYNRSPQAAEETISAVRAHGVEALAVQADIGAADQIGAMFDALKREWGGIDILVNNAAVTRDGFVMLMSEAAWDQVIGVNLRGAYLCSRRAVRSMMPGRWGRIVNVVSPAALVGKDGAANYAAAKGGLLSFGKSLAREIGRYNITVNAVCPGFVDTDLIAGMPPSEREKLVAQIPLGRFGRAEDVAAAVAFLASPAAEYITGTTLTIDGGLLML